MRAIDLLRVVSLLAFGVISIGVTYLLFQNDLTGWIALIIGFVSGYVGTESYYVPVFREKWKRIGVPGYPKTGEQEKAAKVEKEKNNRTVVWIVIVGTVGAALLKNSLSIQMQNLMFVAMVGGLVGCLLRFIWLIYQEGDGQTG